MFMKWNIFFKKKNDILPYFYESDTFYALKKLCHNLNIILFIRILEAISELRNTLTLLKCLSKCNEKGIITSLVLVLLFQ